MKRNAFDERRDQQVADAYLADHMACRWCNGMAHRSELDRYGARCQGCWDVYLAEKNPRWWTGDSLLPHQRQAVVAKARRALSALKDARVDPKAWARRLQRQEESGVRLSPIQSGAWRRALRHVVEAEQEDAA